MTQNQLQYHALQETKRSNLAKETETNRSNLAKEIETNRANMAQESLKDKERKVRAVLEGAGIAADLISPLTGGLLRAASSGLTKGASNSLDALLDPPFGSRK